MKIMLLAGLYLFFVRVLWSVYSELRDPRSVVRKQRRAAEAGGAAAGSARTTARRQVGSPAPPVHAGRAAAMAVVAPAATGQLRVVEPVEHAGYTFQLGREITLGRAPTNGIVLDDTYVSTVHARIFLTNGQYFIEDLASRNGSTLNGQAIVATTALVPGDRLQLGATAMEFS